jgi:hypothetical protein
VVVVRLAVTAAARCSEVHVGLAEVVPDMSSMVTTSAPPRVSRFSPSTLSVAVVRLLTSRSNSAWWPLADRLLRSPTLAPLKWRVSKPGPPSIVSLLSPGFQRNAFVTGAEVGSVAAPAADDDVVAACHYDVSRPGFSAAQWVVGRTRPVS